MVDTTLRPIDVNILRCFDVILMMLLSTQETHYVELTSIKYFLSHDVASGSEITPCNEIEKTLTDWLTG